MNHVIENIYSRHSVRSYRDEPVPRELLDEVLEAGRRAPSGGNNQCSRIYVISNKDVLARMSRLAEAEFAKMEVYEGMYKSLRSSIVRSKNGGYDFTYNAPVNIIVTNKKGYGNAMADSAMLLMTMMLAAQSLGLGTCYTNQTHWLDENEAFRSFLSELGVKDDETVCCGMSIGWPENPGKEVQRVGNEVVFIE